MDYPQYKSDLNHIYQSEVYGANVFRMAMRLTRKLERKDKWRYLYQLEIQTLNHFLQHLSTTPLTYSYPWVWAIRGHIEGFIIGILPWKLAMKLLAKETQSFIHIWQRLKDHAPHKDRSFFDYVYAHEKAIEAFAKLEINKSDRSTQALKSLLNKLDY